MNPNWYLQFFNFSGILNAKIVENRLVVSKLQLVCNGLKLVGICVSRYILISILSEHIQESLKRPLSSFSVAILKISLYQPFYHGFITILLQLLSCQANINLINEMIDFKTELVKHSPKFSIFFNRFEQKCVRNVSILVLVVLLVNAFGYFVSIEASLYSFVLYQLQCYHYHINVAFICFVNVQINFLVYAQRALISHARKIIDQRTSQSEEAVLNDLIRWQTKIYLIKKRFISTLMLPLILALFYYISGLCLEVIGDRF